MLLRNWGTIATAKLGFSRGYNYKNVGSTSEIKHYLLYNNLILAILNSCRHSFFLFTVRVSKKGGCVVEWRDLKMEGEEGGGGGWSENKKCSWNEVKWRELKWEEGVRESQRWKVKWKDNDNKPYEEQ